MDFGFKQCKTDVLPKRHWCEEKFTWLLKPFTHSKGLLVLKKYPGFLSWCRIYSLLQAGEEGSLGDKVGDGQHISVYFCGVSAMTATQHRTSKLSAYLRQWTYPECALAIFAFIHMGLHLKLFVLDVVDYIYRNL